MLPKNRRIKRKDFPVVLSGERYNSPHFLVYIKKNKENTSNFCFSVSKKIAKKATDRNKLRRRGYSVVSKQLKNLKNGYSCFFVYKKDSLFINYSLLEKEILSILSKNNLI